MQSYVPVPRTAFLAVFWAAGFLAFFAFLGVALVAGFFTVFDFFALVAFFVFTGIGPAPQFDDVKRGFDNQRVILTLWKV